MYEKSESCPSVSIVIVNFNGREFLRQCLFTLLNTKYPNFNIVVVDNASTDGSLDETRAAFGSDSRIRIVKNPRNLGHAEGCNIGARMTEGKYIVFLDSDIEFEDENWLLELVKVMEAGDEVGLAQAKIVLADDKRCLDYVCVAVDALGTWAANYGSREDIFKENFEILAASSGCSIIRREVFNQAGGFDADYFIYDDDTDLSLRVRLLGYAILFVPSAMVIHRGGVLRGVSGQMLYHSSKNRLFTLLKNYELKNLWWRLLVLTFFTFMVSVGFLFVNKNCEAKATMKGLLRSIGDFEKIWKKRLLFQCKRRVRDFELVSKNFIRNDFRSTLQDFRIKLKHIR
ncbi:MAG: glycosyltransferase family 2 protein [Candidatus Bathyarchaeota archaeon]|nr:glycosyltransferase family 2 protein [Candidatus Bathyarchaeota archaeon]